MDVKFRQGNYLVSGSITPEGDRLLLRFGFNRQLIDEVKVMEGAKWHGYEKINPRKIWSVPDTPRNRFRLDYMTGKNPYAPYDAKLIEASTNRKTYEHQGHLFQHGITYRHVIWAAEMGTGKTLTAIEVMEYFKYYDCIWVGPKSALTSVQREFFKWKARIEPRFMTYEYLVKLAQNWPVGCPAPKLVVFDECSRLRNPTSQRGQAGKWLADSMRAAYGRDCVIILMSGSPAPKDPTNWWHLCEIACPGFLREGNLHKFKHRLAVIEQKVGFDGGSYPKLISWKDSDKKCDTCGQLEPHDNHDSINMLEPWFHAFVPMKNEVALLYERMRGLVVVKLKKDCLDLPEKQFRRIVCKPTADTLRAAQLIRASASTTIECLTLCRELSDGFQYQDVPSGTTKCKVCKGNKVQDEYFDEDRPDEPLHPKSIESGKRVILNEAGQQVGVSDEVIRMGVRKVDCMNCGATGEVTTYARTTVQVDCPKEAALLDLMDLCEDEGRICLWGGFTGTIDRLVAIVLKRGWIPIRVDGRGWWSTITGNAIQLQDAFDNKATYEKIAFIGQPGAGGMGLNLTVASVAVYYSNTFNAEDRWQSTDRIHRIGADHNRGCTIYDLIHLQTDLLVLDNLQEKQDLQGMSLGMLNETIKAIDLDDPRLEC